LSQELQQHVESVFFSPPPPKQPRAAVGTSRPWNIGDTIGKLTDVVGICAQSFVDASIVAAIVEALLLAIDRLIVAALVTRPALCSAASSFNIKIALSQLDEWLLFPAVKPFTAKAKYALDSRRPFSIILEA